jgi:hypothetical protein
MNKTVPGWTPGWQPERLGEGTKPGAIQARLDSVVLLQLWEPGRAKIAVAKTATFPRQLPKEEQ